MAICRNPRTPSLAVIEHQQSDLAGLRWLQKVSAGQVGRRYLHLSDGEVSLLAEVEPGGTADGDCPFVDRGDGVDQGVAFGGGNASQSSCWAVSGVRSGE